MPDSPITATPYDVLRVPSTSTEDQLKAAYRKRLRETHPDTGGDAASFTAVQAAWEIIGTPEARAIYDRGHSRAAEPGFSWAPRAAPRGDARPRARSHGHPGGWRRERYLVLMREWVGRGESLDDPYDPVLVRSAPRQLRHILADALAEESTARTLSELGIGYTVWHDVSTGPPEEKIDHIVLGPTGLFAMLSEDYGAPAHVRRGELVEPEAPDARPFRDLGLRAKVIARAAQVRFSALVIVLPDDQLSDERLTDGLQVLGSIRGASTVVVKRSRLAGLMREGLPGARIVGGTELFDVRTRLQNAITFV
jgi:hypothetical protein